MKPASAGSPRGRAAVPPVEVPPPGPAVVPIGRTRTGSHRTGDFRPGGARSRAGGTRSRAGAAHRFSIRPGGGARAGERCGRGAGTGTPSRARMRPVRGGRPNRRSWRPPRRNGRRTPCGASSNTRRNRCAPSAPGNYASARSACCKAPRTGRAKPCGPRSSASSSTWRRAIAAFETPDHPSADESIRRAPAVESRRSAGPVLAGPASTPCPR